MNEKKTPEEAGDNRSFRVTTRVMFCILVCVFSAVSSLNPLGVLGLPLAVAAGAMLSMLALSFGDSSAKTAALFAMVLLPYAASAVILRSPVLALAALFPAVLAFPIWLTVRSGSGRFGSIAAATAASAVLWGVYIALSIRTEYGALTLETVRQMIDETFLPAEEMLGKLTFEKNGEIISMYTEEEIGAMLAQIKSLLIGSAVSALWVISYLTTLVARLIGSVFDVTALLPRSVRVIVRRRLTADGPQVEVSHDTVIWRIEPDVVTAGVYLAGYLLSVLFMPKSGVLPFTAAMQNLVVILTPTFIYVGGRDFIDSLRGKAPMFLGCATPISVIVRLFINPLMLVMLLAFIGVMSVFRENLTRRSASAQNGGKGPDKGQDDSDHTNDPDDPE